MAATSSDAALYSSLPRFFSASSRNASGTDRLRSSATIASNPTRIADPGKRVQLLAQRLAEQSLERAWRRGGKLADSDDPLSASLARVTGPTPHISWTGGHGGLELGPGIDHDEPVGLGDLQGDLGEMLGPRHADRDRQTELGPDPSADRGGDLGRSPEEMRAARDVSEGLVDRDALDQRGEVAEHGDRRIAEPLVVAEMSADEDEVRASSCAARPGMPPRTPKTLAS